jgi:excisionase family DNA binding protein
MSDRKGKGPKRPELGRRFLGRLEAARYLNVSGTTIDRMAQNRQLTRFRPTSGRVLFDVEELDRIVLDSAGLPPPNRGFLKKGGPDASQA